MASSDDFRSQLKAGNITEAIALALSQAVELTITTWVASETDDGEASLGKPGHRLCTRINMIEGKIENEIGDQFLSTGPYRELRQFHQDQVEEGNKIIQNNLKSLQNLFEVLVAMRNQGGMAPVIEPDSLAVENQLLPRREDVTDTESAIAPPESAVEESVVNPNTIIQEDVTQEPLERSQEPVSFLTTPTDSIQELDSEPEEDDWDDSILDLLESFPVERPSTPEDLDSEIDEDRRNLIAEAPELESGESDLQENQNWGILRREDFQSPFASPEPNNEALNSQFDEDWGDFIQEEREPHPAALDSPVKQEGSTLRREDFESPPASPEPNIEASRSQTEEDWGWEDLVAEEPEPHPTASDSPVQQEEGKLRREDFESPPASPEPRIEASRSEIDEDWGNMVEEEAEPASDKPVPTMESLDLEEDEEWDDWIVEDPEPLRDERFAALDALDLGEDDEWGDLEDDSDRFAAAPDLKRSASDLEIDEDWDELEAVQLEPYAALLDVDSNIGTSFDHSASLEDTNAVESARQSIDNSDLRENFQTDSSTQRSSPEHLGGISQMPAMTNQPRDTAGEQRKVLFGKTEPQQTQPDVAIPDDNDLDNWEEALLAQIASEDLSVSPEESARGVLRQDSDPLAASEGDLEAKQKPVEKRVPPPPPPPRRFPNQNN